MRHFILLALVFIFSNSVISTSSADEASIPPPKLYRFFKLDGYADATAKIGTITIERRGGMKIPVDGFLDLESKLKDNDVVRFSKGTHYMGPPGKKVFISFNKENVSWIGEGPETILVRHPQGEKEPDLFAFSMHDGFKVKDLMFVNASLDFVGSSNYPTPPLVLMENVLFDGSLSVKPTENIFFLFCVITHPFIKDRFDDQYLANFGSVILNPGSPNYVMDSNLGSTGSKIDTFSKALEKARANGKFNSVSPAIARAAATEMAAANNIFFERSSKKEYAERFKPIVLASMGTSFDLKKGLTAEIQSSIVKGQAELSKGRPLSALLYAGRIPFDAPADEKRKQRDLMLKIRKDFGQHYNVCKVSFAHSKEFIHRHRAGKKFSATERLSGGSLVELENKAVLESLKKYPAMYLYDPDSLDCSLEFVFSQDYFIHKIDNSDQEPTFTRAWDSEGAIRQAQAQGAAMTAGIEAFNTNMKALDSNINKTWTSFYNHRVRFENHVGGTDLVSYSGKKNTGLSDFNSYEVRSAQERAQQAMKTAASSGDGFKTFETLTITYRLLIQVHVEGIAFLKSKKQKPMSVPLPSYVLEEEQSACQTEYGKDSNGNLDLTQVIRQVGEKVTCPKQLSDKNPAYAETYNRSVVEPIILGYVADHMLPPVIKLLEKGRSSKVPADKAEALLLSTMFGVKLNDEQKQLLNQYFESGDALAEFDKVIENARPKVL